MEENTNRWNSFTSIRRKGKARDRERERGGRRRGGLGCVDHAGRYQRSSYPFRWIAVGGPQRGWAQPPMLRFSRNHRVYRDPVRTFDKRVSLSLARSSTHTLVYIYTYICIHAGHCIAVGATTCWLHRPPSRWRLRGSENCPAQCGFAVARNNVGCCFVIFFSFFIHF